MISAGWRWLAIALPLAGFAWQAWATRRGSVKPNRVSWAGFAAGPVIAFAAAAGHAPWGATLVTLAFGVGPAVVLAATFGIPHDTKLGVFDAACGAACAAALIAWAVTRRGDLAIALAVMADALAALPTVKDAWKTPEDVGLVTFLASGAGALITLLTLRYWSYAAGLFPAYVVVICSAIACLVLLRPATARASRTQRRAPGRHRRVASRRRRGVYEVLEQQRWMT